MNPETQRIQRELVNRELARRDYGEYLRYTGGGRWRRTRFSDFLAREVQQFVEEETDNAYDILLIEAPPQHGKSMAVTEALPSWYLGRHPDKRAILASYSDETAERFARRNREKLRDFGGTLFGVKLGEVKRSNEFEIEALSRCEQRGWSEVRASAGPHCGPETSSNRSEAARCEQARRDNIKALSRGEQAGQAPGARGALISRGLLSGITGNPADLLIVDDPVKNRQEADSEGRRRLVWEEWLNSLKSRLAAGAKAVIIMTPWHEDDLAGRLIRSEPGLRLLRLPVEAERDDPLGREPGEPLCPELGKGKRWLKQFKSSYLTDPEGGARAWSALYQCSPRKEEGAIVRRSWWRYYDLQAAAAFATEIVSVDAAFKGGESNDFVAIEVWAKRGNDYYCRYCLNRHMDFPQTIEAIRDTRRRFPNAGAALIEDKANGSAIVSVLQREMFCIPVSPRGGKEARVHAVSPAIESGHVFLPKGELWADELVDQFTAFPAGKHDDMVDAATQALSWLIWSSGEVPGPPPEEEEEEFPQGAEEEELLENELCYDVY